MEIKEMGSYFEIDYDGYIINPTSLDKIQDKWRPAIDMTIQAYEDVFGDSIVSIYLRGSVAKGEAVEHISDIDTIMYANKNISGEFVEKFVTKVELILKDFPFISGIDFDGNHVDEVKEDMIWLNQSVCIYGEAFEVKRLKVGNELYYHILRLESSMEWFDARLALLKSDKDSKDACVWFCKNTLRACFELTMERSGKYTRDLYLCHKDFSEYYPEHQAVARRLLELAINPPGNMEEVFEIQKDFIPWLLLESKKIVLG